MSETLEGHLDQQPEHEPGADSDEFRYSVYSTVADVLHRVHAIGTFRDVRALAKRFAEEANAASRGRWPEISSAPLSPAEVLLGPLEAKHATGDESEPAPDPEPEPEPPGSWPDAPEAPETAAATADDHAVVGVEITPQPPMEDTQLMPKVAAG